MRIAPRNQVARPDKSLFWNKRVFNAAFSGVEEVLNTFFFGETTHRAQELRAGSMRRRSKMIAD